MNGNDGQLPGRYPTCTCGTPGQCPRVGHLNRLWSDFHPTASTLPKREDYDSDLEFEFWKWQDR